MTIDELYKAFNDIEFQATRILKAKNLDRDHLSRFNDRTEEIRLQLVSMRLQGAIHDTMNELKKIDEEYLPKLSFGRKVLNILLFGQYKKRFQSKGQLRYFMEEVSKRKQLFMHAKGELNED
ncbi:MAG: hypothetical protein RL207_1957 [Bacteroidota bacterium]|jgi:hypothetical protein